MTKSGKREGVSPDLKSLPIPFEGDFIFLRKKFHFPSEENKFSFEDIFGLLSIRFYQILRIDTFRVPKKAAQKCQSLIRRKTLKKPLPYLDFTEIYCKFVNKAADLKSEI